MIIREAEVQRLWASGAFRGAWLTTQGSERLRIVYEGRRGGAAGPDFRDAVLMDEQGERRYGDIEIHLRAANWHTHGHTRDRRYDGVALHVVLSAGAEHETMLASGSVAPLAVLEGVTETSSLKAPVEGHLADWPCTDLEQRVGKDKLRAMLRDLGHARLGERAARFKEAMSEGTLARGITLGTLWPKEEIVLWEALAEGLGYGRDRRLLRDAGVRLASEGGRGSGDDEGMALPMLDSRRLGGLHILLERWHPTGPWAPLRDALTACTPREASEALTKALCVPAGAISPARAHILIANVVLPYALARAGADETKKSRVSAVYDALAAPPSNTITRLLARQLGMARLPTGAATHMGLQQVWTTHCRQKLCATCPCSSEKVGAALSSGDVPPMVVSRIADVRASSTMAAVTRQRSVRRAAKDEAAWISRSG